MYSFIYRAKIVPQVEKKGTAPSCKRGEAYGVPIAREIEVKGKRSVALGSVYAALERLETAGLVKSDLGETTPERGGKAKRYFRITAKGLRQVRATRFDREFVQETVNSLAAVVHREYVDAEAAGRVDANA
jgi:DNA-binding PadR family transcriptional regulator